MEPPAAPRTIAWFVRRTWEVASTLALVYLLAANLIGLGHQRQLQATSQQSAFQTDHQPPRLLQEIAVSGVEAGTQASENEAFKALGNTLRSTLQGVSTQPAGDLNAAQPHTTGWYVHPKDGVFTQLAKQSGTDKVTSHNYAVMYERQLELTAGRPKVKKLLEIGLGCKMNYGPGHSAWMWRQYWPEAEIWMADYDGACVRTIQHHLDRLNIKVLSGDQQDPAVLRRWINETGGGFDMIIDDGGHRTPMIYASFIMLFQHALKPGGLYVIEDLHCQRTTLCHDASNPGPPMVDIVKDWIDALLDQHAYVHLPHLSYWPRHRIPPGIRSIECTPEACSFVKCYADDQRCNYRGMEDASLASWGMDPNVVYHAFDRPIMYHRAHPYHHRRHDTAGSQTQGGAAGASMAGRATWQGTQLRGTP